MVTRCPKCATSFRITSAQLQSAKGAVRCGSCLHIFKAHDHLVKLDNSPAAPAAITTATTMPTPAAVPVAPATPFENAFTIAEPAIDEPAPEAVAPTPEPAAAPPVVQPENSGLAFDQESIDEELAALDDDILISDDMDQKHEAANEFFDDFLITPSQNTVSLFERNLSRNKAEAIADTADESWAESLLDEADDEARFEAIKHRISATEATENEAIDHSDSASDEASYSNYPNHLFSLIDDQRESDNSMELLEEFRRAEAAEAQAPATPAHEEIPSAATHSGESSIRAYDTSRAALLMNIMPEPVVMTGRNKRRARQRRLWLSLSVLMLILLVAQVAWLQFDNLSRINPYRAVYGWLCPYLGCQLPTLVDKNEIRVRNLLVRKHPEASNALIVDVILLNTAPFAQPFPDLVMEFSDIDAAPVAARRFSPPEYLRGELSGYRLMPQNQPIHINLELIDPGEAAVNYRIQPY